MEKIIATNLTPILILRSLGSGSRNLLMKTTTIRFITSTVELKADPAAARGLR